MQDDGWQVDQQGRVRWLLIDRPARKNAMTSAMGTRLGELLEDAQRDAGTRVIVISGVGDAFSAGLDRDEIALQPDFLLRALSAIEKLVVGAELPIAFNDFIVMGIMNVMFTLFALPFFH